ncbi:MAG TPA: NADH-quinone oxidoreductase subunit N [bacterium]|jgi:NADH-quinone oxidoreductase subunit N|nr:NADH-quinone oxidoreductase subunit N [bacterium]
MTLPSVDLRLVVPELLLTGAAILVLLVGAFTPRAGHPALRWIAAAGAAAALWQTLRLGTGGASFGGMYVRDALTLVLQSIALVTTLLAVVLSGEYVQRTRLESGEYYTLLLVSALGGLLMAASSDLLMIFLGLETLSIPLYVMAGFARSDVRSQEAGMKYFLLGAFSTVFLLYGIALIYGAGGSTNLGTLAAASPSLLLFTGIGLVTIGLGFKAAVVPFHAWAPDVYEGAPMPVTAFMSVIAKVGAFAAFLRISSVALSAQFSQWATALTVICVATMVLGNLAALRQTNLKRLLAYSSIAHAGFILIGILSGNISGATAVAFYLLAYALMTLGAFGVALMLQRDGQEADEIADLSGLASRSPILAAAMTLFMISLAGLPLTAGFFAKLYVFTAALDAGYAWVAIVGVLASVVSAYYYFRVAYVTLTGQPRDDVVIVGGRWTRAALVAAAAGVLILGLAPGRFVTFVQQVGQALAK